MDYFTGNSRFIKKSSSFKKPAKHKISNYMNLNTLFKQSYFIRIANPIVLSFVCSFLMLTNITGQCNQGYEWAVWSNFAGNSATGTINVNGQSIAVDMTANYTFDFTNVIFNYPMFNGFSSVVPNTTVPRTEWTAGIGGETTMCFSQTVSNPILLLSSLGNPSTAVTLTLSKEYIVIYDGGAMIYVNDTTIIGQEGFAILLFPGNFDCVSVFSSTPEFYTNITWGLNPPLFPVTISGNTIGCDSLILTASGGVSYQWNGGTTPNSATNTFLSSGIYFLTVTDASNCTVTTSVEVQLNSSITTILNEIICQGQDFNGYTSTGTYMDTTIGSSGCTNIEILNLEVFQHSSRTDTITICNNEIYNGYSETGTYVETLTSANGCDSIYTLHLTVIDSYLIEDTASICEGETYDYNGQILSEEGLYVDSMLSIAGCDSVITFYLNIENEPFLGQDTLLCFAEGFRLYAPNENTIWYDNTISISNKVTETGLYWATTVDNLGCKTTDSIYIEFNFNSFIPNGFTPNDDGFNDCFFPNFSDNPFFVSYKLNVIDRWGNLVFSTDNPNDCWNGEFRNQKCPSAVYIYWIELQTDTCPNVLLKGDITLIR